MCAPPFSICFFCFSSRYYTKYFGANGNTAHNICAYALENYERWEHTISSWQQPILNDPELPDWYKSALFNELYYIADGGSIWFVFDQTDDIDNNDPR